MWKSLYKLNTKFTDGLIRSREGTRHGIGGHISLMRHQNSKFLFFLERRLNNIKNKYKILKSRQLLKKI